MKRYKELSRKFADMTDEEKKVYLAAHPGSKYAKVGIKVGTKNKKPPKAASTEPLKVETKDKPIEKAPKIKVPKEAPAAKSKEKGRPVAPKSHDAPVVEKAPKAKLPEDNHKPSKHAAPTPVPEKPKMPKKGSLSHSDSKDWVGKTLGFKREEKESPYNDTPDVTHQAEGDRVKDAVAHFKKLGYTQQSKNDYGGVKTHVMQHPTDFHQAVIAHHPASAAGPAMTIIR
jgi:hypothetical protein